MVTFARRNGWVFCTTPKVRVVAGVPGKKLPINQSIVTVADQSTWFVVYTMRLIDSLQKRQ